MWKNEYKMSINSEKFIKMRTLNHGCQPLRAQVSRVAQRDLRGLDFLAHYTLTDTDSWTLTDTDEVLTLGRGIKQKAVIGTPPRRVNFCFGVPGSEMIWPLFVRPASGMNLPSFTWIVPLFVVELQSGPKRIASLPHRSFWLTSFPPDYKKNTKRSYNLVDKRVSIDKDTILLSFLVMANR